MPTPFVDSASYPVRRAEALDLYIDGEESFAAITEAMEQARSYIYLTVAYGSLNFRLKPPASEQLQDLLFRAVRRGVRVAVLCWLPTGVVADTVPLEAAAALAAGGVLARWDMAKCSGMLEPFPQVACHHQKTFVIDGERAFVGGINLVQSYWDTCAHRPGDDRRVSYDLVDPAQRALQARTALPLHDLFTGFRGPAVADVEANFVQRWNGATKPNGTPALAPTPAGSAGPRSGLPLQVLRTIAPRTYKDLPTGETSIRAAMLAMIAGAQSSLYFENQYFYDEAVTEALHAATQRGVRVVGLLCRQPDQGQAVGTLEKLLDAVSEARLERPSLKQEQVPQAQLYTPVTDTAPSLDIYVHCKAMIADDRYLLVGSANIAFPSLDFHSEMCVLADDVPTATALRRRLWREHLCLAEDGLLPASFDEGADLWEAQAQKNIDLRSRGQAPASRVIPVSGSLAAGAPASGGAARERDHRQ